MLRQAQHERYGWSPDHQKLPLTLSPSKGEYLSRFMQEARSHAYEPVSAVGAAGELRDAYEYCWQLASSHYENFTVGSWLLPRRLRKHIAAIYAYARTADDFADEGDLDTATRLRLIDDWEARFDACLT